MNLAAMTPHVSSVSTQALASVGFAVGAPR